MNFPRNVFRAYDIRGIAIGAEPEITSEFAYALGQAFIAELGIAKPRIGVGRDNRLTGEKLAQALISGLQAAGAEVIYIDYATSPYLYFVVCQEKLDGGINITASHNPPEYNGFKLMKAEAVPLTEEEIQSLSARMGENDQLPMTNDQLGIGTQDTGHPPSLELRWTGRTQNFKSQYFAKLKELAPVQRKLKVVLDCGNGTAGFFAQDFFRELGYEVVELYCEPDGNFPNHQPNPEDSETLVDLQKKVVEVGADIGLAFDGDGDRVGAVNEKGEIVSPDYLLVLLARDLLSRNPDAEVIFEVKCSNILAQEIVKAGGKALRWKTGHSFIKRKMRETGALLAGEISGHIFFKENYFGVDDGLLAAAKLASIVSQSDKKFSEHFAGIPTTHTTPEIKVNVSDEHKFAVMQKIITSFTQKFPDTETLDGVRVTFSDDSWGLIRASNTSPYLTLRFEAGSEARLLELKALFAEELSVYPELELGKMTNDQLGRCRV